MLDRMYEKKDSLGKVLVVGGAGYCGGFMVDLLLANGVDVSVLDNLMFETRYLKDVPFIYGDCRDREKLKEILSQYSTVIWLAAIVGDQAAAIDPYLTKEINENMPKWLAQNFKGKIIFMSTCSVYGKNDDLIDEHAEPNPLSLYAETKLAAEMHIKNHAQDYLIFRLGTLFGIGDALSRIRLDLVLNILTRLAADGKPLNVFGGEQWRPMLHVRDVATATLHGLNNGISGLFNLSGTNMTIADCAKSIKGVIGDKVPVIINYQDMMFEDLRNYRVINSLWLETGWAPEYTVQDGILQIAKAVWDHRIRNLEDPVYSNVGFVNKHYWHM